MSRKLADRLRSEARASRPAFSPALHAQICRVLKEVDARPATTHPRPGHERWLWWATVAAAIVCLVSFSAVLWRSSVREQPGELAVEGFRDAERAPVDQPRSDVAVQEVAIHASSGADTLLDLTNSAVEQLQAVVAGTVAEQQWGYLDHDARLLLDTVTERLPFDLTAALASSEPGGEPSSQP